MKVNSSLKKFFISRKLFILLWFGVVEICLNANASQISCESVKNGSWWDPVNTVHTCFMDAKTSIDSEGTSIWPKDASVKGLQFHENKKIKFLPVKVSESFPDLLALSAIKCSLETIKKANFEGMVKLKVLRLEHNQISTIYSDTFKDLIALDKLDLGKRKYFDAPIVPR